MCDRAMSTVPSEVATRSGQQDEVRIRISLVALAASCALSAAAMACGADNDDGSRSQSAARTAASQRTTVPTSASNGTTPSAGGAEGAVNVTVKEYEVLPIATTVRAGSVTFRVQNAGPDDEHEFVVIKSNLAPEELPTKDDGSVSEADVNVIDELEPFAVGKTKELTVDLEAGSYVLICNVVLNENGENESHYKNGMRASFKVN
jgi:uncharacterized cupredoxin-like copper-binding protein